MKKKAVIRADASEQIGSGHLMRCLTLADRMRREGIEVHFICRDLVGNLNHLVHEQGFPLHVLPRHADDPSLSGYAAWLTVAQETDARETGEVLCTLAPIMRLVVDSYALDEVWERIVRPLVGEIFVIDDLANRKHDCDILLDQNFYRAMQYRYDGLVPPSCKLLLGPAHALLREEFYAAKKKLRRRDGHLRRILVFYGGSDVTHETEKAVRALLHLSLSAVDVDVIIGGSNAHRMQIEKLCAPYDFLHTYCAVSNMAEFMSNADLCLGAGGTTTWERCFLGLPAIVTAIAENQLAVCRDCADAGLIYYLGRWDEVTENDIASAVSDTMDMHHLRRLQKACRMNCEGHIL